MPSRSYIRTRTRTGRRRADRDLGGGGGRRKNSGSGNQKGPHWVGPLFQAVVMLKQIIVSPVSSKDSFCMVWRGCVAVSFGMRTSEGKWWWCGSDAPALDSVRPSRVQCSSTVATRKQDHLGSKLSADVMRSRIRAQNDGLSILSSGNGWCIRVTKVGRWTVACLNRGR